MDYENPFMDPLVVKASSTAQATQSINDYDPFQPPKRTEPPVIEVTAKPPTDVPVSLVVSTQVQPVQPPPSSTPSQQAWYNAELEALKKRQLELDRREAEQTKREEDLRRAQQDSGVVLKNFPPFPRWCPIKPCYYHDITLEIPVNMQKTCRLLFLIWMSYVATIILNMLGAMGMVVRSVDGGLNTFIVSIFAGLILLVVSFMTWYRFAYKAMKWGSEYSRCCKICRSLLIIEGSARKIFKRNNSSFNYMLFFLFYFIQVCICGFQMLGVGSLGSCGWITSANMMKTEPGLSAFSMIISSLFTIEFVAMIWSLRMVHQMYRGSGASIEKARAEMAKTVISNEAVQAAAVQAATTAVASNVQRQ